MYIYIYNKIPCFGSHIPLDLGNVASPFPASDAAPSVELGKTFHERLSKANDFQIVPKNIQNEFKKLESSNVHG